MTDLREHLYIQNTHDYCNLKWCGLKGWAGLQRISGGGWCLRQGITRDGKYASSVEYSHFQSALDAIAALPVVTDDDNGAACFAWIGGTWAMP